MSSDDYETTQQKNIESNRALLRSLGLEAAQLSPPPKRGPTRRRQLASKPSSRPTRSSARLAAASSRTKRSSSSASTSTSSSPPPIQRRRPTTKTAKKQRNTQHSSPFGQAPPSSTPQFPSPSLSTLSQRWTSWTPSARTPPTRSPSTGTFHFPTYPTFLPNKSPSEILHEGAFGGSYFRPLFSKRLGTTVRDDWRDTLDPLWLSDPDLDVERCLTNPTYDAEVNKYGVACGQSIEAWESAGWINHAHDVRGWFQWYCRFFRGRRCDDDERQVRRWEKCVGEKGRWRRVLLKQYLGRGVRWCMDEDGTGGEGGGEEPSPVVSQTCLHWGWEVRQEVLDEVWERGM